MNKEVRILLIEDDTVDQMAFQRALKSAGMSHKLDIAGDVPAALACLYREEFDCIFLDYLLPGGNGLELLKKIRSKDINTPIIVVTSQADTHIAVVMKAGAVDYITKDQLTPDRMAQIIRSTMRMHEIERENQKIERELQESNSKLEITLEAAHIGHWELLPESGQMAWSNQLFEMLGYNSEKDTPTLERFCSQILPGDKEQVESSLKKVQAEGSLCTLDFRAKTHNGERCFNLLCKPKKIGGQVRLFGTLQDITQSRDAETELLNANDRATETGKIRDAFLSNMSHKIRTPMNAVTGFTQLLLKTQLDQDQKQYAQSIKEAGDNLLILLEDILELSNIESGHVQFEKVPFDLPQFLESVVLTFKDGAVRKGIALT
nr:response regulator [Bacteroidota bacterium]